MAAVAERQETITKSGFALFWGALRIVQLVVEETRSQCSGRFVDPDFYPDLKKYQWDEIIDEGHLRSRRGQFLFGFPPGPISIRIELTAINQGRGWVPQRGSCCLGAPSIGQWGYRIEFTTLGRVAFPLLRPCAPPPKIEI